MCAAPAADFSGFQGFLDGFDPDLGFADYLNDPTQISDADHISKVAGQLCYLSFKEKRTKNDKAGDYFGNIRGLGHGSVLEHPNFSFLFYGVSRSFTHELVRHRAGVGYSQVSQRFVDGKALRFVERPENVSDETLHRHFINWVNLSAVEYRMRAERLYDLQMAGKPELSAEGKTLQRKAVNQAARACLPNETEAPIFVTMNARSLRHILEMRASAQAEPEIRRLAVMLYEQIVQVAPIIFADYKIIELPDKTRALHTDTRKV